MKKGENVTREKICNQIQSMLKMAPMAVALENPLVSQDLKSCSYFVDIIIFRGILRYLTINTNF